MNEIENLGSLLHEIRRAVPTAGARRALVDGLIEGAAVPEPKNGGPDLDPALDRLARSRPPPELTYRRVQVLAALTWALPDRFGPDGTDRQRVVAALRPATRDGSRRLGERTHALVCERVYQQQEPHEIKRSLFATGIADGTLNLVIEGWTATLRSPVGTRARLGTLADIPGFRVGDVAELLDPSTWSTLSGERITMTRRGNGVITNGGVTVEYDVYDEVFHVGGALQLTPRLRVVTNQTNAAGWLEYRLSSTQSAGELVKVDQGSIVVRMVDDSVRVETTKRVLLTPPFDAPSLAMQADALGYFDAFEQMVRTAVKKGAEKAVRELAA
jgi:hypothetical protein